jgi:hypothetical protein
MKKQALIEILQSIPSDPELVCFGVPAPGVDSDCIKIGLDNVSYVETVNYRNKLTGEILTGLCITGANVLRTVKSIEKHNAEFINHGVFAELKTKLERQQVANEGLI